MAGARPAAFMTVLCVINQKGGVGKTTTTVNLGAALARRGRRVLLIDLDPQANLSTHLGVDIAGSEPTIYDVLVEGRPLAEAIRPTEEPGLFTLPSHLELAAAEMELVSAVGRETLLRDAIRALAGTEESFDEVLIDCPPSFGVLTVNALVASDRYLIPMQAEFFALQGMAKLMEVVGLVRRRLNPGLDLGGIVACKVDRRARLTHEVLEEIQRHFPGKLFRTMIRPNVKLAEAPSFGKTVLSYAADSNGARDYLTLAAEFLGELPADEDVALPQDLQPHTDCATRHAPAEPEARGADVEPLGTHAAPTGETGSAACESTSPE